MHLSLICLENKLDDKEILFSDPKFQKKKVEKKKDSKSLIFHKLNFFLFFSFGRPCNEVVREALCYTKFPGSNPCKAWM